MRLAISSDIHGNLTALEAVLEHIKTQDAVEKIFCAGDICLFGPRPRECLELIRKQKIPSVVGNTDEWIRNPPPLSAEMDEDQKQERQNLRDWCAWTGEQLDDDLRAYLDSLCQIFERRISPSDDSADDLLLVHANPKDLMQVIFPPEEMQLERFGRIRQSDKDLDPLLSDVKASVLAFGHIHVPSIRIWQQLTLVNVSSVSLPGDGDDRAKYAVLSWSKEDGWKAKHHYVGYQIESEIAAFRQHKPPGWEHRVKKLETKGSIPQIL